ncbi:MAG: 3-deoxy-D-manno-octulosonic acid transferase [Porticoccaceae bacterium]|nr:3-deoxy-D-manno-octulosonic acid transferase [Porticoccaceae bacterium]|tara:strand:- start:212 stop:1522 length:1311 start_codon:yes stop_codon:yes gene_type:complete
MFEKWGHSAALFFYSFLFYLLTPAIVIRLLVKSLRYPLYRIRLGERWGFVSGRSHEKLTFWVHAASVGESVAATPLITALCAINHEFRVHVTCMTPTGSQRIHSTFSDQLGKTITHSYVPYDIPRAVERFLERIRPDILIIMETELWPNIISLCRKNNIPVVLANGRMSEKSASGYERYAFLTRCIFQQLSSVAAQTDGDATRFIRLGVSETRISVTGNIKFDMVIEDSLRQTAKQLRYRLRGRDERPIWVAASTHFGEEEIVLEAFSDARKKIINLLLVITPRHPERFGGVINMCVSRGYRVARSSSMSNDEEFDILVLDAMGELMGYYGACDITFVGGSLVPVGGQSLIEPAMWGRPILSGPYLYNFSQTAELLGACRGLKICNVSSEISIAVVELLTNTETCREMGASSLRVAKESSGALPRLVTLIEDARIS